MSLNLCTSSEHRSPLPCTSMSSPCCHTRAAAISLMVVGWIITMTATLALGAIHPHTLSSSLWQIRKIVEQAAMALNIPALPPLITFATLGTLCFIIGGVLACRTPLTQPSIESRLIRDPKPTDDKPPLGLAPFIHNPLRSTPITRKSVHFSADVAETPTTASQRRDSSPGMNALFPNLKALGEASRTDESDEEIGTSSIRTSFTWSETDEQRLQEMQRDLALDESDPTSTGLPQPAPSPPLSPNSISP